MQHLEEHKWELLAKYHSGECSQDECEQLGKLLEQQPESQQELDHSATIWQRMQNPKVDTENAWISLKDKMNLSENDTISEERKWELLAKHHSGELHVKESKQLQKLLHQQNETQKEFDQSATIWEAIENPKVNTESAWESLKDKINMAKEKVITPTIVTERKWELLAKYHSEEINEEENKELEKLLEQEPEVRENLDESATIWQSVQTPEVNTQNAWKNLQQQLWAQKLKTENTKIRSISKEKEAIVTTKNHNNLYKIAASISLLLVGLLAAIQYFTPSLNDGHFVAMVSTSTSAHQKQVITLPDGTRVFLNENSALSYPEIFAGKTRQVILEGEAFFDVTRNEKKPFIITTNDATVQVLGTSFKVNTRSQEEVEVVVKTGKVALKSNAVKTEKVILEAGFKGTLSKKNNTITKMENTNPNYLAWQTGKIVFEETDMHQVVEVLNSVYNTQIEFAESSSVNCNYNATFEQQPLSDIIGIISQTLSLDIREEHGKLVIYGTCE